MVKAKAKAKVKVKVMVTVMVMVTGSVDLGFRWRCCGPFKEKYSSKFLPSIQDHIPYVEIYSDRKYRLREHVKNVGSFSRRGAVEYIRQENMRDHILTLDFTIHC